MSQGFRVSDSVNFKILLAGMCLLTVLLTISPTARAWQLGAETNKSGGATGIQASHYIHGTLPNDQWYTSISGFYDTGGIWHTIGQDHDGNLGFEWIDSGGSHGWTLCTGTKDTFHPAEIIYRTLYGAWSANWPSDCPNNWGNIAESYNHVRGSSWDWLESNDNVGADFSNLKVYVFFSPSLMYSDSGGVWHHPTNAYSYTAYAPPNTIGQGLYCSPYTTKIGSNWAPPKATGALSINC